MFLLIMSLQILINPVKSLIYETKYFVTWTLLSMVSDQLSKVSSFVFLNNFVWLLQVP